MLAIVKFAIWMFLVMILAAFILLGLQLFGFFIPQEELNIQVQRLSDLLQEAIKIPENQEKKKRFIVENVDNITKESIDKICVYGKKDYMCVSNTAGVNVVFINKNGDNVNVIWPGSYIATITRFNVKIEET
jgi:hypothetical protein